MVGGPIFSWRSWPYFRLALTPRAADGSPHDGSHEANPVMYATDTSRHQRLRYCDYYSFMSLADFLTWVERNDGSEPDISHEQRR